MGVVGMRGDEWRGSAMLTVNLAWHWVWMGRWVKTWVILIWWKELLVGGC